MDAGEAEPDCKQIPGCDGLVTAEGSHLANPGVAGMSKYRG